MLGVGDLRDQDGINANDESQIHIEQVINNYLSGQLVPAGRSPAEAKLLSAIAAEVDGRLRQSLHNRVYVELDKVEDPQWVRPPWSGEVKVGALPVEQCAEGTEIGEVFDRGDIRGQLLILGAPGSGKTTLLLQLAKVLVARAVEDGSKPVPVLLNLLTWTEEFNDISSWLVADLKQKYGVRKDVAEKWIEDRRVLPLLDGLDELIPERQESCVQALNQFLLRWTKVPVVVCSRLEEYGVYQLDLNLNGTVILQPLSDHQIERFLRRAGCDELWEAVRGDSDVMDPVKGLARSPLLLTMLVLASSKLPVDLWRSQSSETEWQRILFKGFIEKRLEDSADDGDKTLLWLGWLAARLIEENETQFFIERLQPYFLATRRQRSVYGLLLGLIFGLFYGLLSGIFWLLVIWLVIGLVSGLRGGLSRIDTEETTNFTGHATNEEFQSVAFVLAAGLILLLAGGLVVGFIDGAEFGVVFVAIVVFLALIFGLFFGLIYGLLYGAVSVSNRVDTAKTSNFTRRIVPTKSLQDVVIGLVDSLVEALVEGAEIDTRAGDNRGIRLAVLKSLIFAVVCTICLIPIGGHLLQKVGVGLMFGSFLGGLDRAIAHSILRLTLWNYGYSPWNYSKFLRYCTRLGFLQRVGGGYRFTHSLLRDHFAKHHNTIRPLKPTR
ncbi:MAG: NACHT domain-containing protein [Cyanobacteria bacterium P01_C01_bin.89]